MENNKKTILIISPNFLEPTAWMVSAYKTALALSKHAKIVVLTSQTKNSLNYEKIENVEVYRTKAHYIPDPFNYTFTPYIFKDLKKLLKKYKFDNIIISKYMFFTSLTGLYLKFKKVDYTLQTDTFPGYIWFAPSKILNFFMWIYTRTLGLIILKLAKKIILLHKGLEKPAKKLGLKNFKIIHNGIDFEKFDNAKPAKDILKIKKNRFLVTYLGRLDEIKGYKFVLKAAEILHKKNKNIHFLFICGNKYLDKQKELQKKYPFISFFGFRKDIPNIFKSSDAHILSSYNEGLPNSILEAMASKCPVISTNVGAVPYLIENKKTGLIINQSEEEIVKAIEILFNNPRLKENIIKNGYKKIKKEFNWDIISKQIIDIL